MHYQVGKHPNTLANLGGSFGGRTKIYSEEKKKRQIKITDTGWLGVQSIAHNMDCGSVTEFLERLARGEYEIGFKGEES